MNIILKHSLSTIIFSIAMKDNFNHLLWRISNPRNFLLFGGFQNYLFSDCNLRVGTHFDQENVPSVDL